MATEPANPIARVLRALPSARRSGTEWKALCPLHDDRRPSLAVREGDGGEALLFCHAQCRTEEVVAKLGLTMTDLFPGTTRTFVDRREVVASYPYRDEEGALLYRVARTEPKKFRFEVPDGSGGWRSSRDCMSGVRRLLYRLPDVIAAVRRGEPVFLVEGEKDSDRVAATGSCGTTVPGGAGKWRTVHDAKNVLHGADVVVVADRDRAGWHHALEVVESLRPVAHVRVVASASGKDFSDHEAAGYRIEELVDVDPEKEIAALEETEPSERETFAMVPRSVIRVGTSYHLDDACLRFFALVDEMPERTMAGRNEVAAVLGWGTPKVTEHAAHLVKAGLLQVIEQPSGRGHKATIYRVVNNPARKGTVGRQRPNAQSASTPIPVVPGDPSPATVTLVNCSRAIIAPADDTEPFMPSIGRVEQLRVDRWRPTSKESVGQRRSTAILSTSGVSDTGATEEERTVALVLHHFPGAVVVERPHRRPA